MKLKTIIESDIFRDRTQIFPDQWDLMKKKFLKKNPGTKSLISKKDGIEYLIHKDDPEKAVLKYDRDNMELYHDMKSNELGSYLR